MKKKDIAPNIIDNSPKRRLLDVIKNQLKKSKEAKFAIGYFFLSGFNLVKDDFPSKIEKKPFLKLIMGNETTYPTKEELVGGYKLRELLKQKMIEDLQKSKLTEEQIDKLKELRELIARKIIDVKLFEKSRLHAKLYLFLTRPEVKYESPGLAVVGSSNFTAKGLTENKELNVLLTSREEVLYLNEWFDNLWNESSDFREDLLKVIELSGVLPGSKYPKIGTFVDAQTLFKYLVYRWFEGRILNLEKKDILLEFQLVGVINAINIINAYNGVILADSVGLGKSFMAGEIIEEFLKGKHPHWIPKGKKPAVLIILPPSLIPQWQDLLIKSNYFLSKNKKKLIENQNDRKILYEIYDDKGNSLGKLGFLSLGLLQNMKENELTRISDEFDLYVIDEAHKYRNRNTHRWKNVRSLRTKKENNYQNKFILLTATPLNNSIEDIFNLIRLFTDDSFTPFRIRGVKIIELLKSYKDLKKKLKKKNDDKIKRELKSIAAEIKKTILDKIMVLRTRKYIMEQFKDLKINGKPIIFKNPKPYSLDYSPFYTDNYKRLIKSIKENLDKINFEHTKLYGTRYVVFEEDTIDEEENKKKHYVEIADLFKLLLGKRLESGVYSFETTLRRIYEKEKIFYNLFKSHMNSILNQEQLKDIIHTAIEKAKIDKDLEEIQEDYNGEIDQGNWFDRVIKTLLDYSKESKVKGNNEIELLKIGLKVALNKIENDLRSMDNILNELNKIKDGECNEMDKVPKKSEDVIGIPIYSYSDDPKFEALKQILLGNPKYKSKYLENIPSLNGKKIIIFTQYKDTAYYLYYNLLRWVKNESDLYSWLKDFEHDDNIRIGLVTGETENKIDYIRRFAPNANKGFKEVEKEGEINILISTDTLSEGINLQDADAVINYDLPWNPMRIVQRVGRVNRIGNEKDVYVINYVPSSEIEVLVGVLKKLQEKIRDITLIVGKDVKILSPDEEISIETFGEKIKNISKLSITELEEYGISKDFKQFIPGGIPSEQLNEYKLLNIIQYELGYSTKDFEEVKDMKKGPYYTFIEGENKTISVYKLYRSGMEIDRRIISISNGKIKYETPLVFLDLIKRRNKSPQDIENAIENLKKAEDKIEELKEQKREEYQQEQKGFLYRLYLKMMEEGNNVPDKKRYIIVMNALQGIPYTTYSKEIKELLIDKKLIEIEKGKVSIKDINKVIDTLYEFFNEKKISKVESLKVEIEHLGWYHEI